MHGETAIRRAKEEDASVVLGSATPSMEAMYRARNGEYVLYEMRHRSHAADGKGVYCRYAEELKNRNHSILREAAKSDGRAAGAGDRSYCF